VPPGIYREARGKATQGAKRTDPLNRIVAHVFAQEGKKKREAAEILVVKRWNAKKAIRRCWLWKRRGKVSNIRHRRETDDESGNRGRNVFFFASVRGKEEGGIGQRERA